MHENIIRQPIELIDEDLDAVAGGLAGVFMFLHSHLDVNFAHIDQTIIQIQQSLFGSNSATAVQVATISQQA